MNLLDLKPLPQQKDESEKLVQSLQVCQREAQEVKLVELKLNEEEHSDNVFTCVQELESFKKRELIERSQLMVKKQLNDFDKLKPRQKKEQKFTEIPPEFLSIKIPEYD